MGKHATVAHLGGILAAVSNLGLGSGGSAAAQVSGPAVRATVSAEHDVRAGRVIDDLDALPAAVGSVRSQAIRLNACGAGTARAQQAAAHRFRNLDLELRLRDADASDCRTAAVSRAAPAVLRLSQRPSGIDDVAVDQWWRELMP